MTTAVDTRIPADDATAIDPRARRAGPRRRLFAKYAAALVGLVSLVLLINGSLDVWFSYDEARDAAIQLQREKADAAAQRIEEFIDEIERQIGWTTATQWASSPIEQRRFDFGRLQRQVPAITEVIQLDGQGREQLKVSRLSMDVAGGGADYSADPRFTEALAKKVWFGPVYFRKESEPYMTMAVAQSGRNAGVTVAEVNLKLIWDVITAIKIGKTGYAYVVDDKGRLIAHPDISRVLRNTDLSGLPQVAAARGTPAAAEPSAIVRNLDGRRVLSASAAIPRLGWLVFVEQPIGEALAPLYTSVLDTGLLLVLGLVVAVLAGLLLARRMTGPIRALDAGAARIGAGALDHRITVHTGDELEELAERFNTMAADLQSSYADLEKKVEDRTAELKEALDQQTATAEVLGVINSSPGDLAPVFDTMLEKAMRLSGAAFGVFAIYDEEHYRVVANHGVPLGLAEFVRQAVRIQPRSMPDRLRRGEDIIQVPDITALGSELRTPGLVAMIELGNARTAVWVALRKDGVAQGFFGVYRQEVRPFSDKQIALLQNFAAQAVIAMENARLITETREALEQQTATAEVLQVINSSPGDLAPVFDSMLEKGVRLSEAAFGILCTFDGECFRTAAMHGVPAPYVEHLSREPFTFAPGSGPANILAGQRFATVADLAADPLTLSGDPTRRALVELGGARTGLVVPLRKDAVLLGIFLVFRPEVRPFTEKQIALLENFAAQAVIAMENARLITELRQRTRDLQELLEYQTATSDVLKVISRSTGDLQPILQTLAETAARLCESEMAFILRRDGDIYRAAAALGWSPGYSAFVESHPIIPNRGTLTGRVVLQGRAVQIADITADPEYTLTEASVLGGARTQLGVPLMREGSPIGVIILSRQRVEPFTEKQIALVTTFADQAVIAIENARLFNELHERTAELGRSVEELKMLSDVGRAVSSTLDLRAVLSAILTASLGLTWANAGCDLSLQPRGACIQAGRGGGVGRGARALGARSTGSRDRERDG